MIKTITVTLYERVQTGTDEFSVPTWIETPVDVPGVLVYPAAPEAVVTDLQIYGKHTVYELCIPKGDNHVWENRQVAFFGKSFRTFGPEIEYIDANVPLKWNRKVKVERYG